MFDPVSTRRRVEIFNAWAGEGAGGAVGLGVGLIIGVGVAVGDGVTVWNGVGVADGVAVGVAHIWPSLRFAAVTVPVSVAAASRIVNVQVPLICAVVSPAKVVLSEVTGGGFVCPVAPAAVLR
jgi:hypothetical protein